MNHSTQEKIENRLVGIQKNHNIIDELIQTNNIDKQKRYIYIQKHLDRQKEDGCGGLVVSMLT